MNFCVNCRHYRARDDKAYGRDCMHPGNLKISPVLGLELPQLPADSVRQYMTRPSTGEELCGPDGRWFQDATPTVEE